MKKSPLSFQSDLSSELLRRKVYPVIVAYAVAAWVILQIGEVTFEPLGLPGWAMTALVVVVIAGFPVVGMLAWVFDITPTGVRRDSKWRVFEADDNDEPSIAVLPFADMSPKNDQGYFCEGIAEEILNALTKIESLRVVARMSSFRYAGTGGDVRTIGRTLGASSRVHLSFRLGFNGECFYRNRLPRQLLNPSIRTTICCGG